MRFRVLFFAFAAALIFIAGPASAARIIVTIYGVRSSQGDVFVGLYASPAKFLQGNECDAQKKVRASAGPITVAFDNLPPAPMRSVPFMMRTATTIWTLIPLACRSRATRCPTGSVR
jgi:uncharacterized protein (DUF2141 family)